MTLSQPTQSPGCIPAPVLPLLFRIGDDWAIPVALADSMTGDPVDLTGAAVTARLYCPFPVDITGDHGAVTVTSAVEGALTIVIAEAATGGVAPQTVQAKLYPCRVSVTVVDTLGRKHTYDPIPILPLRPQDDAPVPTQGQTQVLTAYQQGPAGASDALTVAQINALVAAAVATALAGSTPPPTPSTGTLLGPGPPTSITGQDGDLYIDLVGHGIYDRAAGVWTLIGYLSSTSGGTVAPTPVALVGSVPGGAALTGGVTTAASGSAPLVGIVPGTATLGGGLSKSALLVGTVPGSATLGGGMTTAAPGTAPLVGAVPGAANLGGALSTAAALTGAVPASASLGGAMTASTALAGAITGAAILTGAMTATAVAASMADFSNANNSGLIAALAA